MQTLRQRKHSLPLANKHITNTMIQCTHKTLFLSFFSLLNKKADRNPCTKKGHCLQQTTKPAPSQQNTSLVPGSIGQLRGVLWEQPIGACPSAVVTPPGGHAAASRLPPWEASHSSAILLHLLLLLHQRVCSHVLIGHAPARPGSYACRKPTKVRSCKIQ